MNKQTKRGVLLFGIGAVLLCVALGIFMLQRWEDKMAGQMSHSLLQQ